jgi:uncharacterized LabA/DUF88 family protein
VNTPKSSTYVYVDGFNLYYGCLKGSSYKWLNLAALCNNLLKENNIIKIKYFSATVSPRQDDLDCHIRQQMYFRALKTIPDLEIHLGHFLSHIKTMKLAKPINGQSYVKVIATEEKGSDVNLASHLLVDATRNKFDTAVVISNDSDLLTPIRMVKEEFNKKIGLLNPHKEPARALHKAATFYKPIRDTVLQLSQFQPVLNDSTGSFYKPISW